MSASALSPKVAWTAGMLLIGALYLGHAAIFGEYIADDAGISLAYARNIVAGYGPVLYAGGEAVEGYSNPLWTAALAAGAALRLDGADGIPLMKTLGLLLGLATLALSVTAARIAYPDDTGTRWLAPALLAALTPFVFWTASGMENALYAFLMLLAVTLHLREMHDRSAGQWSSLAITGLALTRPEGIAFFCAFFAHRVICGERGLRLARWASPVIFVYAAFLASRVALFGEWVPNTYYAKVDVYDRRLLALGSYLVDRYDRGTAYVLEFAASIWPLAIAAGAGLLAFRPWRTSVLIGGLVMGTVLYGVYVGGDFWPAGRFFTATLPLLAIAAQHAVNRLGSQRSLAASCAAAVLAGVVLNRSLLVSADLHVLNAGDVLISLQGRLNTARRIQAVAHALGIPDPLVLDPDIGGPAVAGLRVLDLAGLTDVHIAKFHYQPALFREYVFEDRRPDFIRTHDTWTKSSGVTAYPEFGTQYVAIRSWRNHLGLHGEFVRRDPLDGGPPAPPEARTRPASWRQAIEDGRERRRREAARAREHQRFRDLFAPFDPR